MPFDTNLTPAFKHLRTRKHTRVLTRMKARKYVIYWTIDETVLVYESHGEVHVHVKLEHDLYHLARMGAAVLRQDICMGPYVKLSLSQGGDEIKKLMHYTVNEDNCVATLCKQLTPRIR